MIIGVQIGSTAADYIGQEKTGQLTRLVFHKVLATADGQTSDLTRGRKSEIPGVVITSRGTGGSTRMS